MTDSLPLPQELKPCHKINLLAFFSGRAVYLSRSYIGDQRVAVSIPHP